MDGAVFYVPPTQYRLYGRRFLHVKRPNQQYQSTEVNMHTRVNGSTSPYQQHSTYVGLGLLFQWFRLAQVTWSGLPPHINLPCTGQEQISERVSRFLMAQIDYTVPFMSVHAGKYRTEDNTDRHNTQTKHDPEKANNAKHSKTKLPWFNRLYDTRPGNEVSSFYKNWYPKHFTDSELCRGLVILAFVFIPGSNQNFSHLV